MERKELDYFFVQQHLSPQNQLYWREFSSFMNVDLFMETTNDDIHITPITTEVAYFELTAILYIKAHATSCKTLHKIQEIDSLPEHRIRKIINPSTVLFYDDFFSKEDFQQLDSDLFTLLHQQLFFIIEELTYQMSRPFVYV